MSYHESLANRVFDSKMFHCVYALVKHQNKYHKNDLSMQLVYFVQVPLSYVKQEVFFFNDTLNTV